MLSIENARKIGINACIEALGRDFCLEHKDNAMSGYEEPINDVMRCFVCVNDDYKKPKKHYIGGELMPYRASVEVDMQTGQTTAIELITPDNE